MDGQLTVLEPQKLMLYGIIEAAMIPLATVAYEGDREEVITKILQTLAAEDKVIIVSTLIHTDHYDAFRVL
jgi:hypothetical protein